MKPYDEAERLRLKRQNWLMWLHNAYTLEAVSIVMSNAFSKKGANPAKYPEEPWEIFELTEYEKELKAEREQQKVLNWLEGLERSFKLSERKKKQREG